MIEYFYGIPIFGCYTAILLFIVTLVAWKIWMCETGPPIEKSVKSEAPVAQEKKPKKKCGKKGPCKKSRPNFPVINAYFTSDATGTLAQEFWQFLGVKRISCSMNDLRCDFNDVRDDGASFYFVDQNVEVFDKWLAKAAADGKKPLSDYQFAVFKAGPSETAVEYDKSLWKLGAQRLKKINSNEDFNEWRTNVYKIVTGKSKIGCGCDGDESSSCDSGEDEEISPTPIPDVEDLLR